MDEHPPASPLQGMLSSGIFHTDHRVATTGSVFTNREGGLFGSTLLGFLFPILISNQDASGERGNAHQDLPRVTPKVYTLSI